MTLWRTLWHWRTFHILTICRTLWRALWRFDAQCDAFEFNVALWSKMWRCGALNAHCNALTHIAVIWDTLWLFGAHCDDLVPTVVLWRTCWRFGAHCGAFTTPCDALTHIVTLWGTLWQSFLKMNVFCFLDLAFQHVSWVILTFLIANNCIIHTNIFGILVFRQIYIVFNYFFSQS